MNLEEEIKKEMSNTIMFNINDIGDVSNKITHWCWLMIDNSEPMYRLEVNLDTIKPGKEIHVCYDDTCGFEFSPRIIKETFLSIDFSFIKITTFCPIMKMRRDKISTIVK